MPAPPDYNIGGKHNYYFSHMMNCIYDCRYCFLQGMYSSANYVVFVNFNDFFTAIDDQCQQIGTDKSKEATWFFSGYDCDSLALEPVTEFVDKTLNHFKGHSSAFLELRTKSTQIRQLLKHEPLPNCVVAYSLTPDAIAQKTEHKAPDIDKRIECLNKLQKAGWKVGLRFDPMINAENFKELYQSLFDTVFNTLDCDAIHSVSLGPFRLPKPFFKKLINLYPEEALFADNFATTNNLVSYPADEEQAMTAWCSEKILERIKSDQFYPCVPDDGNTQILNESASS